MALTATLGDSEITRLSTVYLCSPVLIRGSLDRNNIKFTIAKYAIEGKKKKEKADDLEGTASLCKNLSDFVADNYAIIYMDFANEEKIVLRQSIELGYIDINFNTFELKGRGKTLHRTYRTYKVSPEGKSFLANPVPVLVASPFKNILSIEKSQTGKSRRREGRGCHHLPKIKKMLETSSNWKEIKSKEDYEFPGFNETGVLYYTKDFKAETFSSENRAHFIYDDNQLSKSSTQTQPHDVSIDGATNRVFIRRSVCEGVKTCLGDNCDYVVSNRQKINRCPVHRKDEKLKESGKCPVQFVYVWPVEDDGKRWMGVLNQHNHKRPAPTQNFVTGARRYTDVCCP